jgi:PAS domain S-box-containing protein
VSKHLRIFPVKLSTSPITNREGQVIAMVGIATEASKEKEIERKFEENERWIKSITQNSPHIIYVYDVAEQRNIYYNRSLLEYLGYEQHDMDEYSHDFFQQITHPEDLPQYDYFFDTIDNWKKGQIFSFEYRLKNKAGQWCWFKGSEREFERRDGKVVTMIGTVEDINEIREARETIKKNEEQYRLLADNASDAIALYNGKFELLYLSPANEKLTGYTLNELKEMPFLDIIYPPDRENVGHQIAEALKKRETEGQLIFRFLHKDGHPVWAETSSKRMFDDKGNLQQVIAVNRDITLRKKAEEILKERNEKFKFLSRSMVEMLESKDAASINDYITENLAQQYPDTIILTVTVDESKSETQLTHLKGIENTLLKKISNVAGIDFIGRKFQLTKTHQAIFQTGNFSEFEGGLAEFSAGEIPPFLAKKLQQIAGIKRIYTIGINSNEKLYGAIHFFTRHHNQIEDKDYIEAFLKQSGIVIQHKLNEQRLRFQSLILDQIYDMVTVTDLDGNITYVNDALINTSGLKREQLYGKKIFSKLQDENPEEKRNEILTEALKKGKWQGEITNQNAAGDEVTLDLRMQPVKDGSGKTIAICGISTDITQRKQHEKLVKESEMRYQNLFNSMTEGFSICRIITDDAYNPVDWEFLAVNNAHEKQTGINAEDIIGKRVMQIFPDLETYWLDFYGKVALTGNPGNMEAYNKNTGKHFRVNAFCPASGQFAAVVTDITDSKLTQLKLIEAKEKAIAANKLKTEFLNKISHEVRTPLNGILGFSEMYFQEDTTDEAKAEYLTILRESSDRLTQTINDYMDISLLSSGTQEVKIKKLPVGVLIENIKNHYNTKHPGRYIVFEVEPTPDFAQTIIETDEELLEKSLMHLLDNAIKFTQQGSVKLKCTKTGSNTSFEISDTGVGISEDMLENIFEPFVQEDNSTSRPFEGSGLGLSIVKKIAELLDYNLEVESIKGKGTLIRLIVNSTSEKAEAAGEQIPEQVINTAGKQAILVAEDDLYSRMLLQALFKNYDLELISASNGKEAIQIADRHPGLNAILMDIKMPGMSGLEAAAIIKERHPQIKIIAQTAFALSGDARKAKDAGCDDYITKPIRKELLFEKLKNLGIHLNQKSK